MKGIKMTMLKNRVITLYDRKTSMRLANAEWQILDYICYAEKMRRKNLLELIDQNRNPELGLTAAVRLFSLRYLDSLMPKSNFGYSTAHNNHQNLEMTLNKLHA